MAAGTSTVWAFYVHLPMIAIGLLLVSVEQLDLPPHKASDGSCREDAMARAKAERFPLVLSACNK
jgi:hypothetical protein